jgi:hypothetical protein
MSLSPAELRLMQDNIPTELKQLRSWIIWQFEYDGESKPTKVLKNPFNPEYNASVSKPSTWSTFDHVISIAENYDGIGLVIVAEEGYCCLDLDDPYETLKDGTLKFSDPAAISARQQMIAATFISYQEVSPSGKGLHIWIKASVPSGRKREGVEIYSTGRYMSFTGNVFNNSPILEYNNLANQLWLELGAEKKDAGIVTNKPQSQEDQAVLKIASEAANGLKFIELYEGRWQGVYPSQSEADQGLCNMLVFYTQNIEQVKRLFKASVLGKTLNRKPKPERYLLDPKFGLIPKAFDKMVPDLPLDEMRNNLEIQLAQLRESKTKELPILDSAENLKQLETQPAQAAKPSLRLSAHTIDKLTDLRAYPSQGPTEKSVYRASSCVDISAETVNVVDLPQSHTEHEEFVIFTPPGLSCPQIHAEKPIYEKPHIAEPEYKEIHISKKPNALPEHSKSHISKKVNISKTPYSLPPGLVGEMARFIHDAAPRPVPEIALAAAIGLMAGVCGRAYNVSGTGLNQYTFLLAGTGRGKEAINGGISKLVNCAVLTTPDASKFIGPAKIASSPALMKYISKTSKSFISVMGEFADTLKKMSNGSRDNNKQDLRIDMLDIYNKSGKGDVLGNLIYSDKDKNTEVVKSPAVSIIGESVPDKFYEYLSREMITEGLLPRFCIIEYKGDRPPFNKNHKSTVPSPILVDGFSTLCQYALNLNNGDNVVDVGFTPEAEQLFDKFNELCDAKINSGIDVAQELWNRAHIKSLKLAALLAVGVNLYNPIIDEECANWALNLVKNDVANILSRFETGDIGGTSVQNEQIVEVRKACYKYLAVDWSELEKINGASMVTWNLKVIPYSYLSQVCRPKACFKTDKAGPVQAIKTCIQSMIDCGEIQELTAPNKTKIGLGAGARVFAVGDINKLK